MFLISVRVPCGPPGGRSERLASQRNVPSSSRPLVTSANWSTARRWIRKSRASSGERRSGSVTTSIRGVPDRL